MAGIDYEFISIEDIFYESYEDIMKTTEKGDELDELMFEELNIYYRNLLESYAEYYDNEYLEYMLEEAREKLERCEYNYRIAQGLVSEFKQIVDIHLHLKNSYEEFMGRI